jgi:hypothetical protein
MHWTGQIVEKVFWGSLRSERVGGELGATAVVFIGESLNSGFRTNFLIAVNFNWLTIKTFKAFVDGIIIERARGLPIMLVVTRHVRIII